MADAPPPPVAIRITRPYDSEEEFLAQELDMISKTSITLVGAQPRPQGVVLRFELALTSGQVLVRGEGRVVGSKPNVHKGVGGLTLRFTRIDARSKAFLDKATSLREMRRPSSKPPRAAEMPGAAAEPPPSAPPPAPAPPPPPPPPAAPEAAAHASSPTPAASEPTLPAALAVPPPTPAVVPEPPAKKAESLAPPLPTPRREAAQADAASSPRPASRPQDRDALLERLRSRAKSLEPAAVQRILDQRRGSA